MFFLLFYLDITFYKKYIATQLLVISSFRLIAVYLLMITFIPPENGTQTHPRKVSASELIQEENEMTRSCLWCIYLSSAGVFKNLLFSN